VLSATRTILLASSTTKHARKGVRFENDASDISL